MYCLSRCTLIVPRLARITHCNYNHQAPRHVILFPSGAPKLLWRRQRPSTRTTCKSKISSVFYFLQNPPFTLIMPAISSLRVTAFAIFLESGRNAEKCILLQRERDHRNSKLFLFNCITAVPFVLGRAQAQFFFVKRSTIYFRCCFRAFTTGSISPDCFWSIQSISITPCQNHPRLLCTEAEVIRVFPIFYDP